MHYVTIPKPFNVLDPVTRQPTATFCPFQQSVNMGAVAASRITETGASQSKYSAKLLRDVPTFFEGKQPGEVVPTPDPIWAPLAEAFSNPSPAVFHQAWVFSGESHERAITDAPTEKPAELTNGVAKEQTAEAS